MMLRAVKPVPERKHMIRYNLKINVPPVDNTNESFKALTDTIKDIWLCLKVQRCDARGVPLEGRGERSSYLDGH
jgi:hypothetical protein